MDLRIASYSPVSQRSLSAPAGCNIRHRSVHRVGQRSQRSLSAPAGCNVDGLRPLRLYRVATQFECTCWVQRRQVMLPGPNTASQRSLSAPAGCNPCTLCFGWLRLSRDEVRVHPLGATWTALQGNAARSAAMKFKCIHWVQQVGGDVVSLLVEPR